jgi:small nuclear ribonucleoprotein (snRNP)-like protein
MINFDEIVNRWQNGQMTNFDSEIIYIIDNGGRAAADDFARGIDEAVGIAGYQAVLRSIDNYYNVVLTDRSKKAQMQSALDAANIQAVKDATSANAQDVLNKVLAGFYAPTVIPPAVVDHLKELIINTNRVTPPVPVTRIPTFNYKALIIGVVLIAFALWYFNKGGK